MYRSKSVKDRKTKSTAKSSNTRVTENAEQHTFKAPCCHFENAPNTALLFFR